MPASPANKYADLLRHDLCAFIHRSFLELNPQNPFHPGWHIEVIAAKLDEVRRGQCKRLIVNLPPRHLKSHAISIAFPAWILGLEPSKKLLSVTYGQDLSDDLARKSRTLMMSEFYQSLFDTRLSRGREAVSDYETTDGGCRLSTSVRGALTGRGADIIIVDDPLKADDALSESLRRSVNEWWDNTLRTRLNNAQTGSIIIVMQRLHADDLVAHVQEQEPWDVLSLPALAEQDETYTISTPYGRNRIYRKEGEILHEALLSHSALEAQRLTIKDYNFTAQYQQNPNHPPASLSNGNGSGFTVPMKSRSVSIRYFKAGILRTKIASSPISVSARPGASKISMQSSLMSIGTSSIFPGSSGPLKSWPGVIVRLSSSLKTKPLEHP